MKILIAVDGSAPSLDSVTAFAERAALWFRATPEITLLHAQPPIPYKAAAAWAGNEAVARYYAEESDAALEGAVKLLQRRGIPYLRSRNAWASRPTRSSAAPMREPST
jgi:hypothetical protein